MQENVLEARKSLKEAKAEHGEAETALKRCQLAQQAAKNHAAASQATLGTLQENLEASKNATADLDKHLANLPTTLSTPQQQERHQQECLQQAVGTGNGGSRGQEHSGCDAHAQHAVARNGVSTPMHVEACTTTTSNQCEFEPNEAGQLVTVVRSEGVESRSPQPAPPTANNAASSACRSHQDEGTPNGPAKSHLGACLQLSVR